MPYQELVFVPQVGFMPARALGTRENVVVERGSQSFIGSVFPDRDGIRVMFTVNGIDEDVPVPTENVCPLPIKATARVVDDRGRVVPSRARWITGPMLRSAGTGQATLQWTLVLEAPEPDARELTLTFDGPAGEWKVALPLAPIEASGTPARRFDATDTRHGITVAARALARSSDRTVVELEAYLDPPSTETGPARRYVLGLGASMHAGRVSQDEIVLRDDLGGREPETGHPCAEPTGGKQREAVSFGAIPDGARSATVEVGVIWVQEGYGEKF